ncbi:MAG: hypothetical protein JWP91_3739 [Fibrobacteres bacterium]|nr:hypothetical protein [Fibrobacterota bacterium]
MKNLKFLHSNAIVPIVLACLLSLGFLSGCAGSAMLRSPGAAEKYAVRLANEKCAQESGKKPFRTGRFPATHEGDRWLWGWLDAAGAEGYTAQVSFRSDRSQPEVRVFSIAQDQIDMESPDAPRLDAPGFEGDSFTKRPEP